MLSGSNAKVLRIFGESRRRNSPRVYQRGAFYFYTYNHNYKMSKENDKRWDLKKRLLTKFGGRCAYCGISIELDDFHIDHVISKKRYLEDKSILSKNNISHIDHFDNLHPSCAQCNIYKCDNSLENFREYIETQINRLRRRTPGLLLAEKYGLIEYIDTPVVFYFEKVS